MDLLWLVLPGSLESQAKILPGCCRSTRGNLGSVTVARGFFVAPYQLNMAWTSKCLGFFQADSWLKTAWIWRDLVMTVFVVKQTFLTIWSILKCHTGAKPADFVWMCLSSNWNWTPSRLLSRSTVKIKGITKTRISVRWKFQAATLHYSNVTISGWSFWKLQEMGWRRRHLYLSGRFNSDHKFWYVQRTVDGWASAKLTWCRGLWGTFIVLHRPKWFLILSLASLIFFLSVVRCWYTYYWILKLGESYENSISRFMNYIVHNICISSIVYSYM